MDGVVSRDNQHQVSNVGLRITTYGAVASFEVVTRNHTSINGGISIIYTFHVAGQKPCNNKRYHRQDN